ncbi:MAG: hypothetical protein R3F39_13570 [Myxococcota bacterium]
MTRPTCTPDELRGLYDLFHGWLPRIRRSGHVLVWPHAVRGPHARRRRRCRRALRVRALRRQRSAQGATARAVYVERGADDRLPSVLSFLLSERSAFISGQVFHVGRAAKQTEPPKAVPAPGGQSRPGDRRRTRHRQGHAQLLAAEGAHVVVLDRPRRTTAPPARPRGTSAARSSWRTSRPGAAQRIAEALQETTAASHRRPQRRRHP